MYTDNQRTDVQNRIAGAVVGSAVGDALGAGFEFGPAVPIERVGMIGGGGFQWEPGEWTDDTQMSICVLKALANGADPTTIDGATAVAEQFLKWFSSNPPDVGNQTRSVLTRATSAASVARVSATFAERNPSRSAGNGSLMRTVAVPLPYLHDRTKCADAARAVSDLTHFDPLARDACVLWCEAIRVAIATGELNVRGGLDLLDHAQATYWAERIAEAEANAPIYFTNAHRRPNGFVVHAFQCAWSAIATAENAGLTGPELFVTAVGACVAAGDDADTTAAIAGALAGAAVAFNAIPQQWTEILHGWPTWTTTDLIQSALSITNH